MARHGAARGRAHHPQRGQCAAESGSRGPDRLDRAPPAVDRLWRGFACTRVSVPLDHDKPNGRHISLALIRLPATDQRRRIGSLLTNFGGPGLPAIDRIRAARDRLPVEIRARFDVIGMDPRGVGESSPLRCFPDQATQEQLLGAVPLFPRFPVGRGEQDAYVSTMRRLGEACLQRNADLMHHMSTANVARDLDLLRGALGDDGLTFYGASYGSYLGMVYATLSRRARALVFDWSSTPTVG